MLRYNTTALYMRKQMIQTMDKIWGYPLTVVESPMGYGKTTAVKEYLNSCETTVLWETLAEDSVSRFWNRFARLLKKIDTTCAENLVKLGFPDNSIFMDEAMALIERVDFPEKTVMVIDDYHLLSSEEVDKFIELLVKSGLSNLHIIIISRVVFGENMVELARKGYCYIVDRSSFEFSRAEIVEYYKLCGVKLKPHEISALYSYTEGWVSALYLCMLNFLQEGYLEQQASLHELIEKVVYRPCSAEEKEFLLNICIFDSFTLAQAKVMWNKENVEEIVRQLMANNAFIKYDKGTKTYQMHNIFTSYLREIMGKLGAERQQVIFLAAGEWCVCAKDYIHAMEYFYKAVNFDKLLTVIEIDKSNSINSEHKEALMMYFKECPAEVKRKYPIAALLYAADLFTFNEMELFTGQCEEVIHYLDQMEDEQRKKRLLGELEILYSFTKYNDITAMSAHHRKAHRLLDRPSELFDNTAPWTFGSPSILYMFYRKSGELEQEVAEIMECMPYYCHITAGHGCGAEYVMQAELYYHRGNFEQAEIVLHKAMYIAQTQRQWAIILSAMFLQMRLAFVKGNLAAVMKLLQEMNGEIKQYGHRLFAHTAEMCEGFIYSGLKEVKKIPHWIAAGQLQESRLQFPCHGFFNIVYGKALLLGGEYLKLIGIAQEFMAITGVFPNLLGNVYTHIYVAAAQYQLNHDQEAQLSLRQGMDIAAADQLIMPFVENGEYILPILITLERDEKYADFAGRIRKLYVLFADNVKAMTGELEKGCATVKLTEREREIARLVASGLSNRVIAETLHVAEVTVKKALQNIYAKLGVGSRTGLARIMIG